MKPTIEELHQSGQYRLIETVKIDETMQFLARELGLAPATRPPNQGGNVPELSPSRPKKWLRFAGVMVLSMCLGWFVGTGIAKWGNVEKIAGASVQFLVGLLVFFPLITVHEFIHGIFFKRVGAPRVGYGWSWKGMMAYAYAQNYVLTTREVAYVAVTPFVFISTGIGIAWLVWPHYAVAWGTLLFLHTTGCLGDFALIRFWQKNRHRQVYTYDDVEVERKTYFFERVKLN